MSLFSLLFHCLLQHDICRTGHFFLLETQIQYCFFFSQHLSKNLHVPCPKVQGKIEVAHKVNLSRTWIEIMHVCSKSLQSKYNVCWNFVGIKFSFTKHYTYNLSFFEFFYTVDDKLAIYAVIPGDDSYPSFGWKTYNTLIYFKVLTRKPAGVTKFVIGFRLIQLVISCFSFKLCLQLSWLVFH